MTASTTYDTLIQKLTDKSVVTGVIGLGYVGLPFCMAAVSKGLTTIGFDIDPQKCVALAEGRSYLKHLEHDAIRQMTESGRFDATTDFSRLTEADVLVICVPTPLTQHREPDLSYLIETTKQISAVVRPGSNDYPGIHDLSWDNR